MIVKRAKEVIDIEIRAIKVLKERINKDFLKAVDLIAACGGKVIVTGIGKPGMIARKISATLSSIGVPSIFLHPAEAIHGDLGMVSKKDVIIALSNSGETEEIIRPIATIKKIGAVIICICGNKKSTLAKESDYFIDVTVEMEACPLGLAPTASTTAMLVMGDALAMSVLDKKGIKKEDFAFYHPGGSLGKKLLKIEEIMRKGDDLPIVKEDETVKDVLLEITRARTGCACIVDKKGKLTGIFTDGDLRRNLEKEPNLISFKVKQVMTPNPLTIEKGSLAGDALNMIKEMKIDEVPVVDKQHRPVGLIDVQDFIKIGFIQEKT
ncbi:MAG: KpsF/GutQ family sugar-phosphate isomerase [Candidatus Omnitrophota bacterium]